MAHRGFTSSSRTGEMWWRGWHVGMSICLILTAFQFVYKFRRPSSKWQCTSSCDRSRKSWFLAYYTTVFQWSWLGLEWIFLRILLAAACSCLKEQRERIMCGGISTLKKGYVPMSKLRFPQLKVNVLIIFSELPAYSVSSYPCITVQLQSPLRFYCYLASRTPL
jgi:hypothetical protein